MRVYSAFNGFSGANVALDRAYKKVTTYMASETDKWCNAVTRYNYPETVFLGDITKINPNCMKDIDLMIGGSPCQDVSFSGKGKGLVEFRITTGRADMFSYTTTIGNPDA